VQDDAAIRPASSGRCPAIGTRVSVVGRMGMAYGAPRLTAESLERSTVAGSLPAAVSVRGPIGDVEWRLVRAEGVVCRASVSATAAGGH
jgi:hypothetical protein